MPSTMKCHFRWKASLRFCIGQESPKNDKRSEKLEISDTKGRKSLQPEGKVEGFTE